MPPLSALTACQPRLESTGLETLMRLEERHVNRLLCGPLLLAALVHALPLAATASDAAASQSAGARMMNRGSTRPVNVSASFRIREIGSAQAAWFAQPASVVGSVRFFQTGRIGPP